MSCSTSCSGPEGTSFLSQLLRLAQDHEHEVFWGSLLIPQRTGLSALRSSAGAALSGRSCDGQPGTRWHRLWTIEKAWSGHSPGLVDTREETGNSF